MNKLFLGLVYMVLAQMGTYVQLNCSAKFNWYEKHKFILLAFSIPISWLFIKSVQNLIDAFEGELWPQRIIGFGVGVVIFAVMSYFIFKEPLTMKTIISILLACLIIIIQIFF